MLSKREIVECANSVSNRVLQNLLFVLIVFSVWFPIFHFESILCWHAIFCTIGVLTFMSEGLILLGYDLLYTFELEKETKHWLHIIFSGLSTVCLIIGVALGICADDEGIRTHFSSSHGVVGLVFLIFLGLCLFLGLFAKLAKKFSGYAKPILFVTLHNISGILCFILAVASMCTGYYTDVFHTSDETKTAATTVMGIVCLWCLGHSFYKLYKGFTILFA